MTKPEGMTDGSNGRPIIRLRFRHSNHSWPFARLRAAENSSEISRSRKRPITVHDTASPEGGFGTGTLIRELNDQLRVSLQPTSSSQSRPCSRQFQAEPFRRTAFGPPSDPHKTGWFYRFECSSGNVLARSGSEWAHALQGH